MSEGSVFQRKSDAKWCAKYKDASGKWRYLYRKTRPEVRAALKEALKDRDEGIDPTKITVNAAIEIWLEETKNTVSERTWINRNRTYRNHIQNHSIGNKKLAKVTPQDVRGFYAEKSKVLAPSTLKFLHNILNKPFGDAVKDKQLRSNPVSGCTPKLPRRDLEVLTPAQVRKLLEACRGDRCEGVVVLGAACALRIGEILGLAWDDVDLEKGTIHVRRTLWHGKTYRPKTPHSRRTIKLPNVALEVLVRLADKQGYPEDGFVFVTSNGTAIEYPNFWRWHWKPLIKKVGLPSTFTFHTLRHGCASILLNQNIPIPIVSKYLGHSNSYVTMRTYTHMIDGMGGMAADGMDEALG